MCSGGDSAHGMLQRDTASPFPFDRELQLKQLGSRTLLRLFLRLFQTLFSILFTPNMLPAIFGLHSLTPTAGTCVCMHSHIFSCYSSVFFQTSLLSRAPRTTTAKFTRLMHISSRNTVAGGGGTGRGETDGRTTTFLCVTFYLLNKNQPR